VCLCVLCADGVPAESLYSHCASAQDTSIHVLTDTPAGRPLRLRFRTDALSKDGLSRPASGHAAHTVNSRTSYLAQSMSQSKVKT